MVRKIPYTLIDHTADLGIHVFGDTIESLYANAGYALFDLLSPYKKEKGEYELNLHVKGEDFEDLMINWLRELLYIWTGEEKLLRRIIKLEFEKYAIGVNLTLDHFNPDHHVINHEIKAITYHQAQVRQTPSCWEACVIFDT